MTIKKYRFDYYVLMYLDGEFTAVLCSTEYHSALAIAKLSILKIFNSEELCVPVLLDYKGIFHYYHPEYKCWFKNLSDVQIKKRFGKYFSLPA